MVLLLEVVGKEVGEGGIRLVYRRMKGRLRREVGLSMSKEIGRQWISHVHHLFELTTIACSA